MTSTVEPLTRQTPQCFTDVATTVNPGNVSAAVKVALALAALGCVNLCQAQHEPVPAYEMKSPPAIDGSIDEGGEWNDVPSFQGLVDEQTGEKAPESGQFWLAYDKDFIYFAARLPDSQPASIRATEHRTNVSLAGDDYVALSLDLSGSLADFNLFAINPAGATDIELAGGRAAKREWSGEFFAKSRITQSGWEVEARIPWQVMRLPGAGKRDLRFNVVRQLVRTQRTYSWAFTGNGAQPQNNGRWANVPIPKTAIDHSIKLLPYTYLGHGQDEGFIFNSGVDVKTNLTEEVPLVLSVNPDFRNIENAILSLDFSRFERLADETRPFFQEGSQYFNSALFASQRVPGFDAGLNVHGKLSDKMSFGLMDTIDFGNVNNFVGNFTYDPNPKDSFRITATNQHTKGIDNDAYLLRYQRLLGDYFIFLRTMGTRDATAGNGVFNSYSGGYSKGPHNLFVSYDLVSPDFLPRLGFAPETNYKGPSLSYEFQKPVNWGSIAEIGFGMNALDYQFFDGGHYRNQFNPSIGVVWKGGAALNVSADWEDFMGDKDHLYDILFRYPRGNPYDNWRVDYQTGRFSDVDYKSIGFGRAFRPLKDFQVTANYQHVEYGGKSDQMIVGLNYLMRNDQSISGRLVRRGNDWNGYLAFRRSGNKGTEYYLILGDPNAPRFKRTAVLKVVVPLQIG